MAAAAPADAARILYRAERLLTDAQAAFERLRPDESKPVGDSARDLRDIAVFGEASLRAIETLKSNHRAAFTPWYTPYDDELRSDELMQYFRNLRNLFLKEGFPAPGDVPASTTVMIDKDPNSERFIVLGTATTTSAPSPPVVPTTHRGEVLGSVSLVYLCHLYMENLWRIYDAAVEFVAGLEPVGDSGEGG